MKHGYPLFWRDDDDLDARTLDRYAPQINSLFRHVPTTTAPKPPRRPQLRTSAWGCS